MTRFCDFCECNSCKFGWEDEGVTVTHAPTNDGKWICDVCFSYDVCTSGPNRNPNGPCNDTACKHRPTLDGPWRKKGVP